MKMTHVALYLTSVGNFQVKIYALNSPLLRLRDLSDNASAKAFSSPGLVFFGEANNDSS